jgi:hypothetical protein
MIRKGLYEPVFRLLGFDFAKQKSGTTTRTMLTNRVSAQKTMVVSLLEKQVAPWVIVTTGKLWRLYSSTASNKATNYYEIDLEDAIASNDQITALKYWWLMFRRQAFSGFLDKLLKDFVAYAKELGNRLKDRLFA